MTTHVIPLIELLYADRRAVDIQVPADADPAELGEHAAALARVVRAMTHVVAIAADHAADGYTFHELPLALQGVAALADLQQLCTAEAQRRAEARS